MERQLSSRPKFSVRDWRRPTFITLLHPVKGRTLQEWRRILGDHVSPFSYPKIWEPPTTTDPPPPLTRND